MEIIELSCQEGEPPAKFQRISPDGDKRLNVDVVENSSVSLWKYHENVEKKGAPKNVIDKLDYDCLAKVLTYISPEERLEMEKVCEKWKEATRLSWYSVKKLNLRDDSSISEESKVLEKCCQYLTHLNLFNPSSEFYEIVKNKCHNIINFKIYSEHDEAPEKILNIITSMSKLKHLTVGIKKTNSSIDFFTRLFDTLPSDMEEIHLKANYPSRLTDSHIHLELPDNLKSLRRLELEEFILPKTTIQSILLNKNTLVHLDLWQCKFPTDSSSMFSNLNNLEHLKLFFVVNLNVDAIIQIAHNCPKLKHFVFSSNNDDHTQDIPYRIFRELKYLNNLEYLNISNVIETTDEDAESFISCIGNNSKLTHLDINTITFLETPTINFKDIKKLKKLKYLSCARINSQQLIDIANNCSELKTFITSFRNDISAVDLEKLANLEKLKGLTFNRLNNLTDDVLIKIVSGCKNLESLNIDNCKNITGDAFLHFGKLKYLKRLSIRDMANVPNAMFDNLYKLEYLSCSNCPSVTDKGIIKVIDNCQKLCYLYLSKIGVTNKVLLHEPAKPRLAHRRLNIRVDKSLKIDDSNIPDGLMSLPHDVSYI